MGKKEVETYYPKSKTDWRNWLEKNHQLKKAVCLIFYKTSTNAPSISWSEAVDEALCFGWIDSTKKTLDKERYMQYFTRRKPNSNWSKVNKEKVTKLIQNNQMSKAGYDSIETAKQNRSWTILDEVEALKIPDDLIEQLKKYNNAIEYFDSLSKSNKKILLHWIVSAKRPETRKSRINEIAKSASQSLKPKQFR
ncbi:YdeI/OmpD-associated family protein [Carboxylicivirga linearis]|uniref:YdeI/OmpD-associated family protein n=1 Tax=Carboxylicivirga linearis TaxID=1628157 RepID=A0ABS5JWK9_9BACT|nr:YdeI/OmpD-associated family protein [Carboxylicivirga linearis]MBS2099208.1 YdeI/OmpD-associated family protein [Carboxylicivirga linearis]